MCDISNKAFGTLRRQLKPSLLRSKPRKLCTAIPLIRFLVGTLSGCHEQTNKAVLGVTGCATKPPYDYTNFKNSDPKSIIVLPPKNSTTDVTATYGFYTHTQRPLSEAGFYVLPVTVVDEIFKANGISVADEMHLVNAKKLNEIFGADAGLYINIKAYGTKYFVIGSAAVVTAEAKLVDLKTGELLWEGVATASSEESQNNQQAGGLAGLLVTALIKQIVGTAVDQSYAVGKMTSDRLLTGGIKNGILYGPRNPLYKK